MSAADVEALRAELAALRAELETLRADAHPASQPLGHCRTSGHNLALGLHRQRLACDAWLPAAGKTTPSTALTDAICRAIPLPPADKHSRTCGLPGHDLCHPCAGREALALLRQEMVVLRESLAAGGAVREREACAEVAERAASECRRLALIAQRIGEDALRHVDEAMVAEGIAATIRSRGAVDGAH